jgi:hypothetical protein
LPSDHSQNTVKAPNQTRKEKHKEVLPEKVTKSNRINCTTHVWDNITTGKESERKSTRNKSSESGNRIAQDMRQQ